eukprot:CAMPEP_0119124580 /NCGR_PEP_ID=MMETSP1310-20130426/4163_1 /TAXON_ID=464262 /ORGANISM="Genus nov. species nov., Strain RCC2339" /LENGTH=350 /DNA_ID=CAMNT_0007114557 /DNA_START=1 /DNA_END=1053 /DNA_ORIENTATION=+
MRNYTLRDPERGDLVREGGLYPNLVDRRLKQSSSERNLAKNFGDGRAHRQKEPIKESEEDCEYLCSPYLRLKLPYNNQTDAAISIIKGNDYEDARQIISVDINELVASALDDREERKAIASLDVLKKQKEEQDRRDSEYLDRKRAERKSEEEKRSKERRIREERRQREAEERAIDASRKEADRFRKMQFLDSIPAGIAKQIRESGDLTTAFLVLLERYTGREQDLISIMGKLNAKDVNVWIFFHLTRLKLAPEVSLSAANKYDEMDPALQYGLDLNAIVEKNCAQVPITAIVKLYETVVVHGKDEINAHLQMFGKMNAMGFAESDIVEVLLSLGSDDEHLVVQELLNKAA